VIPRRVLVECQIDAETPIGNNPLEWPNHLNGAVAFCRAGLFSNAVATWACCVNLKSHLMIGQ